ncbi:MAG: hypothetical protein HFG49_13700 [Lachnospiraceae bacterium]|jgi:hypothetical protein|nr:hypothetical protein [Lachnospiraceae bacterium]
MSNLKSIYLRNLIDDFWKKKKIIGIFILICAVAFAVLGIQQASKVQVLTEEQQEEIDDFNEKIKEYDTTIADVEESLKLANQQIEELQKYMDQSIYMKLDSQNIQVASVQYGLQTEANTGNILNALNLYINEGGLKEALSEEWNDLAVETWREIISTSITANLLNITIVHYDEEQLKKITELVKTRIQEQVPQIASVQGNFTLKEIDTAFYTKADVGILNSQNNNRNNLKNYISNRSDLENKKISQQNNKKSYIEKNEPEVLEAKTVNPKIQMATYMVVGILFGIMLPALVFILQYILGNRIRSKEDLQHANLNVVGSLRDGKQYEPALERSMMDVELLAKQQGLTGIFLNALEEDDITKQTALDYAEAIKKAGFQTETGFRVYEDAEQLKKMIESKGCLLLAQVGKTTYSQLEQQIQLCQRFQVKLLGCIVIG